MSVTKQFRLPRLIANNFSSTYPCFSSPFEIVAFFYLQNSLHFLAFTVMEETLFIFDKLLEFPIGCFGELA
ncbi:hypothetical protein LguiA_014588 [Lonicera macranthoides]